MLLLALALGAGSLPAADIDSIQKPKIDAAMAEIDKANPQRAIDLLDPVISAYESAHKSEKRWIFCGMSGPQTLAYMMIPAAAAKKSGDQPRDAVAVGSGYCDALFLKGYALIDLNRVADARSYFERVIALAPMHSHYLAEMGQSYRLEKNWPKMLDYCQNAFNFAALAPESAVKAEKGIALRCMGYAKIELGAWDDAERLFKDSLKLDPQDTKAKNELQYIAENRPKRT